MSYMTGGQLWKIMPENNGRLI